MRYQIYEAKSVKHDAQQRVGIITTESTWQTGVFSVCHFCYIYCLCAKLAKQSFSHNVAIHRNSSGLKISAVGTKDEQYP